MAFFPMIKTLILFSASLTILLAIPSSAQTYNHLLAGERLNPGDSLVQGHYFFTMQYDCNLVLYDYSTPLWASGTQNKGSGCYAIMQRDGNLVVYDSNNNPLWASNTNGEEGNYILILQKDRNVVIYSNPIWATGTNQVGWIGVVVAAARNGTVGVSGAEQNKVREMGKIMEV
ncbi:mannose-specific lectin-like [Phalaenopsis equestris]|uniref:mannose-specific lectin-like n=1 Tax=Phalaenopsis equestris TaxID=78828 RepID=UPI0009E394CD|nr:mannose-specific lectin-like [Phalaenopsis equestris]XP_020597885.1 mannose-specific lectin-like [Phalaenopsis equestris]